MKFGEKLAKLNIIRILVALATSHKWKIHQLDVKYAFLNGDLKEEVYLVQPEGFVQKGQEHLVCKLKKAIYGLKQAPRSSYIKIDTFFNQKGLVKSKSDPNLYMKKDKEGHFCLISLYVDDLIITGNACKLITDPSDLNLCALKVYLKNVFNQFAYFLTWHYRLKCSKTEVKCEL